MQIPVRREISSSVESFWLDLTVTILTTIPSDRVISATLRPFITEQLCFRSSLAELLAIAYLQINRIKGFRGKSRRKTSGQKFQIDFLVRKNIPFLVRHYEILGTLMISFSCLVCLVSCAASVRNQS